MPINAILGPISGAFWFLAHAWQTTKAGTLLLLGLLLLQPLVAAGRWTGELAAAAWTVYGPSGRRARR